MPMTNTTQTISFEEYTRLTGKRFRLSRDQQRRVATGEITREDALRERFASGLDEFVKKSIPDSVWLDPELSLANYSEKTGRRFRMTREQTTRNIGREAAFQEILSEKRSSQTNA
jgi:hypothetical protein